MSRHPRQFPESVGESGMVHVAPHCCGLAECEPAHWTHWFPFLHNRDQMAVVS